MALSATAWPEDPVPEPVKNWLSGFFQTADTPGQASAEKFASFFTEDGSISNTAGVLNGREAIVNSRSKAWDYVEKRDHQILRVYTSRKDFSDILLIGRLDQTLKNGKEVGFEFVARAVFKWELRDDVKAEYYQVWANSAPMVKAMGG